MLDEHGGSDAELEEFDVNQALTDEEQAALFRKHFKTLADLDDQVSVLKKKIKNAKAQAKLRGITLTDLAWAMQQRQKDSDIVVQTMERRFKIAGWLNFAPVGYQPDLFKDDRSTLERAYAKGAIASTFNKQANPALDGYDATSEEGQSWLRGFNDEQAESKKHLAAAEEKLRVLHAKELAEAGTAEAGEEDPADKALPQMAGRKVPRGGRKKKG